MTGQQPTQESAASTWSVGTLVVTNATKVAGLVIALNEAMVRDERDAAVMIVAAVMMIGAQAAEQILLRAIDRFFGA
jgi:hypothetical protein